MRRCLFVVAIVVLSAVLALPATAQMKFGVGMRVGMNFGTLSFNPDIYQVGTNISKTGRTGFMIGAMSELEFAKMFAVEFSPTYVMKGGGYQDTQGGTDIGKYNELELPILFKVKFLQGMIRPYAFVGPNIGLVMSATEALTPAGGQEQDTDVKSNTSSIDFALDFGGGAELMVMKNLGILMDVRYSLGLSNINSATQQQPNETIPTVHASGFQIMVGSMFHL
ncbi:MAG TPA: porin family protein [Bacteroidota bacterium]|nr:porin family protein [Bacteroidota bacterium]